jgi:hypothetical protein
MGSTPYRVLLAALDPGARRENGLPQLDHAPDPWESSMQATCECLSWRGTLDNLERRHAEDALGETVYHDFPVHTRSRSSPRTNCSTAASSPKRNCGHG